MLPYEEKTGDDTLTRPSSVVFLQSQVSMSEHSSQVDRLKDLINEDVKNTIEACREARQLRRFPELMSLFMLDVGPPAIDRSLRPDLDQPVSYISVKCTKHDAKLNFEPLFFSVFLYDLKFRHKLSETFHFDRLEPWMFEKLKNHVKVKELDVTSRINEAVFALSQPTDELYIVIRIEKVLQPGDVSQACEPYLHVDKNLKSIEKLKTQSSYWCEHLGAYRMPFAWTATNLIAAIKDSESQTEGLLQQSLSSPNEDMNTEMSGTDSYRSHSSSSLGRRTSSSLSNRLAGFPDVSGSGSGSNKGKSLTRPSLFKNEETFSTFLTNFHPLDLRFKSFFIQDLDKLSDDDIATCLSEFKKDRGKKFKSIDIELSLDIRPAMLPLMKCLNPDLQIMNCPLAEAPTCKLILDFPVSPVAKPYSDYINLLYVYPKVLNLSSKTGTARNILMKVKLVQGSQHGPIVLTKIFGKSTEATLKDVAFCPVNYHSKVPKFYDEIKIQLPATLGQLHHLLFEFYHITCNSNKRELAENETFVGSTWLPLLDESKRLVVGDVSLPISSERLPADYYRVHPKVQLPSVKWLDGHKELFTVFLKAHSSVHTMDAPLDNFLKHYSAVFANKSLHFAAVSKQDAIKLRSGLSHAIECLYKEVSLGSLIHFLHVTLDKLLSLVVRKQSLSGDPSNFAHNAFEALVNIVDNLHKTNVNTYVDGFNRVQLLLAYVQKNLDVSDFQYDSKGEKIFDSTTLQTNEIVPGITRKTLHSELLIQIMSAKNDRSKLMQRIWFFFEVIVKSLANENLQNVDLGLPRLHSFDDCLNGDIGSVISNVTEYINQLSRDNKDTKTASYLNFYLAFFVSDLLSVCNRYWVFNYVKSYVMRMNSFIDKQTQNMSDPSCLVALKLEFLRVVSTHEHFVILNLPFYSESANMFDIPSFRASNLSSVSQVSTSTLSADSVVADTLSVDFKQNHFLMGLLLQEFKLLLPSGIASCQKLIISILCQIAQFIDRDSRYSQPFIKSKVVALFLPLIKIVITNKELLTEGPKPFLDSAYVKQNNEAELESKKNKIAGIGMGNAGSFAPAGSLSPELTRNVLSIFLWVFKNLDSELLLNWWQDLSEANLVKLFQVIRLCVQTFEYRGKEILNKESIKSEEAKLNIEGFFFGNIGARNEMIMRRRPYASNSSSRAQSATNSLARNRWDKNGGTSIDYSTDDNERLIFESNVCCETVLVCLDLTDYMLEIIISGNVSNYMVKECVALLADILSRNQTPEVYLSCLNLLRVAVKEHAQFVLLDDSELCAELCLRLLRISCMQDLQVRAQATIVLYFIMRLCFDLTSGNSLSRLKIQLIVALSSLVNILDQDKASNLQKSIQSLSKYSGKDSELLQTSFPAQIEDLVSNLQGILLNTIKMHEFDKDPEMHMDLMYEVAKGYQSSIQLRLTWLDNMRLKHKERENFAEAAMCSLHSAAFICEGLFSVEQNENLPIGATEFEDLSQNVLEECIFEYGTNSWNSYNHSLSKDKIVNHLEQAAKYFHKAQLFEFSIKCFEHLVKMHSGNSRDYRILSDYNAKIQENCNKILNLEESGKRSFSTFFRVGFYGKLFEDLDGKEYVYKEAPYAQLSVISTRLESFYQERFVQPNIVEILKSSNHVERNSLDPNKAYIQVTYVEPYFDYYRDIELTASFERNTNINEFVYNIPFTKSGRPHGGLKEQYKKRVVLRTEQTFPYLKTRLEVIDRTEEVRGHVNDNHRECYKELRKTKILKIVSKSIILIMLNSFELFDFFHLQFCF